MPERDVTRFDGRHPFQGVTMGNLSPRFAEELGLDPMASGVIVLQVDRRSPAARRQFVRAGDVILSLNDNDVGAVDDLEALLIEPLEDYIYKLRRRAPPLRREDL